MANDFRPASDPLVQPCCKNSFAGAPDGAFSQTLLGLSLGLVDGFKPARQSLAEQMMFGRR
jgi:hypothetical protein